MRAWSGLGLVVADERQIDHCRSHYPVKEGRWGGRGAVSECVCERVLLYLSAIASTVYLPITNKINVVSGVFDVCMISECCGCFDLLRVHGCIYGLTPLHHELGWPLVCRSMGFGIAMFGFEVNVFLGKMEGGRWEEEGFVGKQRNRKLQGK